MSGTIILVPGYTNSGPEHWQSYAAGFGEWPAGEQLLIELCGFELERC